MNRKEQILEAAKENKNDYGNDWVDGAEWADANPTTENETTIFELCGKLAIAVEALKWYGAGYDPSHELTLAQDADKIPVVQVINVPHEIYVNGKSGKQVFDEGMAPKFNYKLGKKAREALADIAKLDSRNEEK